MSPNYRSGVEETEAKKMETATEHLKSKKHLKFTLNMLRDCVLVYDEAN